MVSLVIALSQEAFVPAARVILLTYLPLAVVESVVTGTVIAFLWRVSPELLLARFGNVLERSRG